MLLLLAALLAAEASIDAGVGLRGERRASIGARAGDEDLRVSLAAMRFAGPQAPEREELSVAAETEHLRGEFKVVPMSAGLLRGCLASREPDALVDAGPGGGPRAGPQAGL